MDLFLANLVDVAVKDDMATMEHPMFAIGKQRDMRVREFTDSAGNRTRIAPGVDRLPTVWDKGLLIYAVSQLIAARAHFGYPAHSASRPLRFPAPAARASFNGYSRVTPHGQTGNPGTVHFAR